MKTLNKFLEESKKLHPDTVSRIRGHMDQTYQQSAPDLPKHGQYHYHTAQDHVADRAHDHFSQFVGPLRDKHKDIMNSLRSHAKHVVKRYADNDTADSKKAEKKRQALWAKRSAPPKEPKAPKEKSWDNKSPPPRTGVKTRRGVGSY